jgi:hypothetical protein
LYGSNVEALHKPSLLNMTIQDKLQEDNVEALHKPSLLNMTIQDKLQEDVYRT